MKGAMSAIHVAMLLVGILLMGAVAEQAHPVVKVISMLEGLKAKTEMMGKVEAGSYAKFQGWCKTQSDTLTAAIDEEKSTISELDDTIAGKTKEQKGLETQIADLSDRITEMEASAFQAKKVRADEAALYKSSLKDFSGTIKAVGEALDGLKKAGADTKTGLLLAQQKAKQALNLIGPFASEEQRAAINEFLQEDGASIAKPLFAKNDKAEALNKYDFKSGNVVELMKAMKDKFQAEKMAATKAETNSLNAYELSSKARDEAINAAKGSKQKRDVELSEVKKALSDAKGDSKDQKADLEADSDSLSTTKQSCLTKQEEWEKRSQTRELELEAMDMAIKILAKVTGVRTELPDNPVLPPSPVTKAAFVQLESVVDGADPKMRAVTLIRETAKMVHSRALERLAEEINVHMDGPFDQVNNMVEKMIFRLMAEQTEEDKHKKWCDQELAMTEAMKDDKDDKLEELDAKLKTETAGVAQLTEDVKAADAMINKIVASMQQATEIRNAGKQENMEAIADAEEAQKAILKAIDVLDGFYKDSGMIQEEDEAAFFQAPAKLPKSPSTWDAGYNGVADPTKQPAGIISVLKAVNADFEKLEAETKSQEVEDQQSYEQQILKEEVEKARRSKEVEMKGNRKMQKVDAITQTTGTRKNVGKEQEKAAQYLSDLKGACVSGDSSYENRKKARDAEIAALQKAQGLLEDAFKDKAAAFLSKAKVHLH
jgi:DNA repair exonuclease SbcCD ATPase subunit